ncbi:efflux RND transporter permease subunit, partial [bacterium]|nr:efflux RND transporter permease subunit [bacterium]
QPMLTVRIFTAPLRLIWILFAAIIPPMRRWLDDEFAHLRGQPRGLFRLFQMGLDRFHGRYHRVLVKALAHPVLMIVLLLIGLGAGGFLASRLDRSFLPESSSGNMRLDLELTAGTSLDETRALSGQLAEWLEADEAVYAAFSQIGTTEKTLAALNEYTASNTTRMTIILEKDRNNPREAQRIQGAVADRLKDLHDISFSFREEGVGLREVLGGDGAPFSLGVVAEDPQLAAEVADDIMNLIERVPGLVDLKVDRVLDSPNLVASLNREEILRQRLNSELISRELRDRVTGVAATTFNEIDQRIDIAVRLSRDERRDLNRTLSAPIELPAGGSAPLGSFLTIDQERPVRELLRRNQRRMVTLSGELQERGLDDVWEEVLLLSESYPLPEGVELIQTGEQEAMRKSFRDLGWALILAVLLVYMILAAQFESFLDPLLIAAVIPIGIAGSALAIWITGNSINTLSLIGVVALLGISVNDAIVKVDTIRRLRADGMPGHAAIFEASRLRLRPILMTSCTTILAMLPMAIGLGSGEQMQRPLAITIIGGLALTTTLTLFYTPVLYQMAHRLRPERESSS